MNLWLEVIWILVVLLTATLIGRLLARSSGRRWLWGYWPSLLLMLAVALPRRFQALGDYRLFGWLMGGRLDVVISAIAIPVLGMTLYAHCPRRSLRYLLALLLIIAAGAYVLPAYLGPALMQNRLRALSNSYDADGICRQQTSYTCGPAAAVIALEQLGFAGDEGELAVAFRTSPLVGTDSYMLAAALRQRYATLTASVERWHGPNDFAANAPAIVAVRYGPWTDHFVTVLSASAEQVVVGDPLEGYRHLSWEQFQQMARPTAVFLRARLTPDPSQDLR